MAVATPVSHRGSYGLMGAGIALVGASFLLADRADDAYDDYRIETEPGRIESLYDRAVLYDRFSGGSLTAGEALLSFGLYWRFIRRPPQALGLAVGPARCVVSYRF